MIRLALYHPQIPQNTGTILRLSSCLGMPIDLIRPFGFVFCDKKLKRSAMDYISTADYIIHNSFDDFLHSYQDKRIIAMEANNTFTSHHEFKYDNNDILIVGSEHYGFLECDLERIQYRVKIPMLSNRRSINMAIASTIIVSEALSQLKLYPEMN